MRILLAVLTLAALTFAGCATPTHKQWAATGGSRADATIKLSFQYNEFEKPIIDENQGLELAKSRCQSWGYESAEAFGGITNVCTQPGQGMGGGCGAWLVTKEYQCLGQGSETEVKNKPSAKK